MIELPNDKVGISPRYESDRTPGGLYIPDIAKTRVDQGVVKYLGPQVTNLRVGDFVIFSGYSGTLVITDEERLIILPEEFVIAVLHGPVSEVKGLYYRVIKEAFDVDEIEYEYIPATYESVIDILNENLLDAEWRKGLGLKDKLSEREKSVK